MTFAEVGLAFGESRRREEGELAKRF